MSLWKIIESEEKKEKEAKDQEFTYQNLILENPEIETPNFQTPQNPNNTNSETINQQNLPPQPLQPPQQPQQLSQQPQQQLQQPNLDPMACALIAKLKKFTGKKDDTQIWLNNIEKTITANGWNNTRALQVIPYFLQNIANSCINQLTNTFTTIKQGENEAVTTYLGCFYKNLCQIQAIQADYFTAPQILNQFIRDLRSSILQHICPMHPVDLQAAVTNARNFETTKLEANYAQTVNLPTTPISYQPQLQLIYQLQFQNSKTKIDTTELEIVNSGLSTNPQFSKPNLGTKNSQNPNVQHYLSLLVTPKDTSPNQQKPNQHKLLISNILPATITNNKLLATIFSFEFEKTIPVLLFSEATLDTKPITTMYTDAKVDDHTIKLILNSRSTGNIITQQLIDQLGHRVDCAASTCIITADRAIKTPIGKIDDFSFEVNGIIVLIKVLTTNLTTPLIEFEKKEKKLTWEAYQMLWAEKNHNKKEKDITKETTITKEITSGWKREYSWKLIKELSYIPLKYKDYGKKLSSMRAWIMPDKDYWMRTHYYCKPCHHKRYGYPKRQDKWNNKPCLACSEQLLDKRIWNDIPGRREMYNALCQYMIFISDWVSHNGYPHDKDEIWWMANAKIEGAMPSKILEIKNNPLEPVNIVLISNPDAFLDLETGPEEFHKHYQNLALTREEQKQCLAQINTQLCDYCLISCDFQYCNECDFIYNLPSCMIYMIPEEEPINNCTSESELTFNPDSNSNNDDAKNNGSSFTQYGNKNNNDSNSNSNSKTYITLLDLTKKQKLK
ncbi:hypothetical protein G9A89_016588 [Geosiphon pyriformis]|nr:hypothetical protein G9A89_016588 [Geosiphon pyriformis]